MNVSSVFCSAAFLVVVVSARAGQIDWGGGGELLVDHVPWNGGGLTSDSMGFEFPGSTIVYQFVADDFTLAATNSIRRIKFWGFYNSNAFPTGDETIRVRFYDARPSDTLPGEVLAEKSFVNVPRVWTGRNVIAAGGGQELEFEGLLDQALTLAASTKYWLEVAQIGDSTSSFRWEMNVLPPINSQAFNNAVFPDWTLLDLPGVEPNAAFQLYSIPEPTTLALVAWGVAVLSSRGAAHPGSRLGVNS